MTIVKGLGTSDTTSRTVRRPATGRRVAFWFVATLALCLTAVLPAAAEKAQARAFDLPSQPLPQSLRDFSDQSGFQIAYPTVDVTGVESATVKGSYTAEEALAHMLRGTGLGYRMTGANTATLEKQSFRGHKTLSLEPVEDDETPPDLLAQAQRTDKPEKVSDTGANKKVHQMKPVKVIADREKIRQGVNSYFVPDASASTKTNTPLIEAPQSISVVTGRQMRDQKPMNLNEALRYTPGVQSEPFGFETRFTNLRMRGFDATTTGLYRDGLQLRNPAFAIGYSLEPYSAERIEVPRGPASVLYGQGNPGGLVNFVSKRPTREPLHEFIFEPGNFDFFQGKFDISDKVSDHEELSYRLTGLFREAGTQVDFVRNDRIFIAPALTWQPTDNTSLTILTSFMHDEFGISQRLPAAGTLLPNPNGMIPTNTYTGEDGTEKYKRSEYSLGYLLEHRFNNTWTVRQNVRLNSTDVDDVTIYTTSLLPDNRTITRNSFGSDGMLDAIALDNQVQAKFATGPLNHTVLVGLDYQYIEVGSTQTFGFGASAPPNIDIFTPAYGTPVPTIPLFQMSDTSQEQVGLYFQDQVKLLDDRLILQVGGRHDWTESSVNTRVNVFTGPSVALQDNDKFTFRGGAVYRSEIGLAPYFSYSQSFLPVVGANFAGNPFKPETGEQYEVGLKYQPPGWNSFLTFSWFDIDRSNVTTTDPGNVGFQVQTGEVNSQGIELEAVSNLDFGLSLIGSYTYLDVEITSSNNPGEVGSPPAQTPDHMASLWADYTVQNGFLKGLGVGGGVRHIGSTFGDNTRTLEVPSVTLGDAVVHYDWQGIRLALNVQNVADTTYVASCFAAGQDFCTYGAKRTMRATVGYRW